MKIAIGYSESENLGWYMVDEPFVSEDDLRIARESEDISPNVQGILDKIESGNLSAEAMCQEIFLLGSERPQSLTVFYTLVKNSATLDKQVSESAKQAMEHFLKISAINDEFKSLTVQKTTSSEFDSGMIQAAVRREVTLLSETTPTNQLISSVVNDIVFANKRRALVDNSVTMHKLICKEVEAAINALIETDDGCNNWVMVEKVRNTIKPFGLMVVCPKCGHPADLFVSKGPSKRGSIRYRHYSKDSATSHGGKTRLEFIKLVAESEAKLCPEKKPNKF